MTKEEAVEWINGNRSMTNQIPQDPFETWLVRINAADAAMVQQAYWTLKAHSENLMPPIKSETPRREGDSLVTPPDGVVAVLANSDPLPSNLGEK